MPKKLSEKLWAKFPATTPWCSILKITHLEYTFPEVFLTASKPSRRSITAAKTREKEKKERRKKIPKIEKPKDMPDSQISCTETRCWQQERPSCCVANAFLTGSKVIWPRSSLKITKMSKNIEGLCLSCIPWCLIFWPDLYSFPPQLTAPESPKMIRHRHYRPMISCKTMTKNLYGNSEKMFSLMWKKWLQDAHSGTFSMRIFSRLHY